MVPEGWRQDALGELVTYKKGFAFDSTDYSERGVRVIRISDTNRDSIHSKSPVYVPECIAKDVPSYRLNTGDIILSTVGSRPHLRDSMVGKAVRVSGVATGSLLNQNLVKLVAKHEFADPNLLYLWLKDERFIGFISSLVRGNANQVSITLRDIFSYKINIPPLPEQRKIADILSTWDQAIETTEALLANARTQKRALMQQLLTGKRRFPEFDGQPWKEVRLGDVASISMGSSPKSAAYNDDGIGLPLIQGNADVKNGRSVPRTFTSEITTRCQPGDILLSVRAPVGSVAISDHDACVGRGAAVIRPKGQYDWQWLKHLMLWLEPRWSRVSQGSTFEAVNSKDLKTFIVPVPATKEEAKHIGSAIEAAHLDCDALSDQITKLRTEKKALMQQLLTGKRRVVV